MYNPIDEEGWCSLAEVMFFNTKLKWLNLAGTKAGPKGAAALGEGLKKNKIMRVLNLCNVNIDIY